jgi:hypothetical protein
MDFGKLGSASHSANRRSNSAGMVSLGMVSGAALRRICMSLERKE